MDNVFLQELSALLRETEKLLACPEPDTEAWASYGRNRREAFARLQATGTLVTDEAAERAAVEKLVRTVLERDRLLMEKLEEGLARCRTELSGVAEGRRALRGYLPPRPSTFLQRNV
jgi:hypothetical protein